MATPPPPVEHQFKPGESGNPDGRPLGSKNLTTLLREALQKIAKTKDEDGAEITYELLLTKRVLKKAIEQGDMRAIELIYSYLDGKPQQKHKVELDIPQNLIDLIRGAQPAQPGGGQSVPTENKG